VKYVVIGMSRNRGLRVYVPSKNNTPYFKLSEMEFFGAFLELKLKDVARNILQMHAH